MKHLKKCYSRKLITDLNSGKYVTYYCVITKQIRPFPSSMWSKQKASEKNSTRSAVNHFWSLERNLQLIARPVSWIPILMYFFLSQKIRAPSWGILWQSSWAKIKLPSLSQMAPVVRWTWKCTFKWITILENGTASKNGVKLIRESRRSWTPK